MAKKRIPNLIVEFASDSGNIYYLSVLEYRRENYLVVIDNVSSEEIGAYVLDYAQQERLDLGQLMSVITYWFYRGSTQYPLSFEFSRLGMTPMTNRIYKTFELAHVTRLIGYDFKYDFETPPKVRRRRVNLIPAGTPIRIKRMAEDQKALVTLAEAIAQQQLLEQGSASELSMLPSSPALQRRAQQATPS